jgi:hypothetical protein
MDAAAGATIAGAAELTLIPTHELRATCTLLRTTRCDVPGAEVLRAEVLW